MTKRKRTNKDLQNTTQKTKNRATQTSLKLVGKIKKSQLYMYTIFFQQNLRYELWFVFYIRKR